MQWSGVCCRSAFDPGKAPPAHRASYVLRSARPCTVDVTGRPELSHCFCRQCRHVVLCACHDMYTRAEAMIPVHVTERVIFIWNPLFNALSEFLGTFGCTSGHAPCVSRTQYAYVSHKQRRGRTRCAHACGRISGRPKDWRAVVLFSVNTVASTAPTKPAERARPEPINGTNGLPPHAA